MVSWKAGLITTKAGFQAPGSMCLVKDLHTHQLEKGTRHLEEKTLDLLIALALGIQIALGDRYKPVNGRKTGARVSAVNPKHQAAQTPGPFTPARPARQRESPASP
eukprot:16428881-Heterocapsa_arctica.AAC.1